MVDGEVCRGGAAVSVADRVGETGRVGFWRRSGRSRRGLVLAGSGVADSRSCSNEGSVGQGERAGVVTDRVCRWVGVVG